MARFIPGSLTAKVALIAMATVMVVGAASFRLLQDFYRRQMIDSLSDSTTIQGELIEQSLRYAMHTRSLDLLAEMVRSLASQKGVEKVMILNKQGTIRFSSLPEERGTVLARSDPTCEICHRQGLSTRGRTVVFENVQKGSVFRNVNPILNSETCQPCHPASDRVNGILIVDYSMQDIEASLAAGGNKMWLSALAVALAVALGLLISMRRVVLDRLQGLVQAIDSFEPGCSVPEVAQDGIDEISQLSQHLGRMMEGLDGSIRDLRQREAYLDSVINSAEDAIVVVDDAMQIVTANRAYETLRGADRDALLSSPCGQGPICEACELGECPGYETLRTGQVSRRIRTLVDIEGNTQHYEISASPLLPTGDRPQALEVWRNITRRRELEAQLAHSERLASLGFLASGLSHEINNPLASISACIDGLRRRLRDSDTNTLPPELPGYLDLIRGEVQRCHELSTRLKGLGRQPDEVTELVDLGAVIHDTIALVKFEAAKCKVEIEERLDGGLSPVLGNDSQLRQVVLNLLLNAIQAIDESGRVWVRARQRNGGIELEVQDDGRGIPAANLRVIFEPFYSARPDGHGTGLGLFISKIIVDRTGGTIDVHSEPARGTTFTLWFPAAAKAAMAGGSS